MISFIITRLISLWSEPPASTAQDGTDGWSRRGQEIADEISQDDLPSAHLPGLQPTSTSERPKPSSFPPEDAVRQSGRGWILVAALLAVACVAALWWLSRSPVDDESSAPASVTVPVAPGDAAAVTDPAPAAGDTSEPAAETTAAPRATSATTDAPTSTSASARARPSSPPPVKSQPSATRPRMID